MSAEDRYFQFPLALLAYGKDSNERLNAIIDYCIVTTGACFLEKPGANTLEKSFSENKLPRGWQKSSKYDYNHRAIRMGMHVLKVKVGNMERTLVNHKCCLDFNHSFIAKHGGQPLVRIRADILWGVRDKNMPSYREWSVLCAVYSCIGATEFPVRITRLAIQCRMLGYKSQAVMQNEIAARVDGVKPLTERQITSTLNALHERQFFARARANERQTFYSHRLDQAQLENKLIEGKSYSLNFHQRRVQRNAELISAIKAQRDAIKVHRPHWTAQTALEETRNLKREVR